jgi:lysophospholipase L1-like esterase
MTMQETIRSRPLAGKNLLLVVISTLLAVAGVETLLRLTMDKSDLYSSFPNRPALNQWRNEVQFWERYEDAESPNFGSYDALLGWDSLSGGDRIRGTISPPSEAIRIVAIGDSFVWGNEVQPDENFSAVLNTRFPRLEVLNMGVPGYGIDQAYLKYLYHGSALKPDVVLFGVYVSDYERASVAFTAFSKPRFVTSAAGITLENQPVPTPIQELERIGVALAGRSYLLELLKNSWRRFTTSATQDDRFFDQTDPLISHIFESLRRSLSPTQRLLVLHIPRGESFLEPEPSDEAMQQRLLAIYKSLQLPYIDLSAAFQAEAGLENAAEKYYVVRPNGSIGHLNPAGHARAAELIARHLGLGEG